MAVNTRPYFVIYKGVHRMVEAAGPAAAARHVVSAEIEELRPARAQEILNWTKAGKPVEIAGEKRDHLLKPGAIDPDKEKAADSIRKAIGLPPLAPDAIEIDGGTVSLPDVSVDSVGVTSAALVVADEVDAYPQGGAMAAGPFTWAEAREWLKNSRMGTALEWSEALNHINSLEDGDSLTLEGFDVISAAVPAFRDAMLIAVFDRPTKNGLEKLRGRLEECSIDNVLPLGAIAEHKVRENTIPLDEAAVDAAVEEAPLPMTEEEIAAAEAGPEY